MKIKQVFHKAERTLCEIYDQTFKAILNISRTRRQTKNESDRDFMIAALSESETKPTTFYENMGDEEIETRYEAVVINEATEYAK
ncbi:hypothetical protein [Listeria booriae]|uniref:Uncharacterized protein n=1 Tax=Listeria booriae TaxID=1552123 RepID=A0A842F9N0_9LIST|nr:hypothetical protein [Listeria booriae]MBC2239776.1 hypothetical protein [Listeria booriae]